MNEACPRPFEDAVSAMMAEKLVCPVPALVTRPGVSPLKELVPVPDALAVPLTKLYPVALVLPCPAEEQVARTAEIPFAVTLAAPALVAVAMSKILAVKLADAAPWRDGTVPMTSPLIVVDAVPAAVTVPLTVVA